MKRRVEGFTGIRFFWAVTIVICHIYLVYEAECKAMGIGFDFLTHGAWGVCSFLVISGFLMCMHYESKYDEVKSNLLKEGFALAIKNAKKWYVLYLICSLPALAFLVLTLLLNFDLQSLMNLVLQVVMNVFLVQAWIPGQEYSINGVAWYLSCMTAIYLVTPFLLRMNSKIKNNKKICWTGILICLAMVFLLGDKLQILYSHPFYRVFQFVLGVLLYNVIKDVREIKFERVWFWVAILINIAAYFVLIPAATALVDTISVVCIIVVLYLIKDDNFFTRKWILDGGKKSLEIFLMHYPIVTLGGAVLKRLFPQNAFFYAIEMLLLFVMVFVAVEIYRYILKKVKGDKHE